MLKKRRVGTGGIYIRFQGKGGETLGRRVRYFGPMQLIHVVSLLFSFWVCDSRNRVFRIVAQMPGKDMPCRCSIFERRRGKRRVTTDSSLFDIG